jgi:hypothetical protein
LKQGHNFVNTHGSILISELEIIITLQSMRGKYKKLEKETGEIVSNF